MNKFKLMGAPVIHSLSPLVHTLFAKQFNIQISYDKTLVMEQDLKKEIDKFILDGGVGINLTTPLKTAGVTCVDNLTIRAKIAKAINTVFIKDNKLWGDNTDGIGLVRFLQRKTSLENKEILILGSGGVLKGALPILLECSIGHIHIANRTIASTKKLVMPYEKTHSLSYSTWDDVHQKKYDIILHATSLEGDHNNLFNNLNVTADLYFDIQYQKTSAFLAWVSKNKYTNYINGVGMLVEQAAEGFYIWHGLKPKTQDVIDEIYSNSF